MPPLQFHSMDELNQYLDSLENRIASLESEKSMMKNSLSSMGSEVSYLVQKAGKPNPLDRPRFPNTSLLSDNFLLRAFSVWGHYFVAQLLIGGVFFILYLIIFVFILGSAIK